ncbi:MAG: hypothetical protein C0402_06360 [Thermodesulfovibrio sp.]|nr:hypothetical protein [Thermodesulfovibrio sp.]
MMKMVHSKRGLRLLSEVTMFLVLSVMLLPLATAGATDININGSAWRLSGSGLYFNPDGSISLEAAQVTTNAGTITGTVDVPNTIIYLKDLGAYKGIAKYTVADRFRNFSFNNLPDGKYEIFPLMDGFTFAPHALSVTIPIIVNDIITRNINLGVAGGDTFEGNFAETFSIYGTMNGLTATSSYAVKLTIKNPNGTVKGELTSNTNDISNGFLNYMFSGLEAGLDYTVTLQNLTANTSKTVGSVTNLQGDRAVNDIQVSSTPAVSYILSVTKSGNGTGTVTGTGISCGSDCTETYGSSTSVTLTAAADATSIFNGWSGACTGQTTTCTVSLNALATSATATATFNLIGTTSNVLTVAKGGSGSGTVTGTGINCGSDCTETYNSASATNLLTATAAAGSVFSGWSGNCTGASTCSLTMNANKSVMANFDLQPTGTVSAPACTSNGGSSTANPKCLVNNSTPIQYTETIRPGELRYYSVTPAITGATAVLKVEIASLDQLADCDILVQEGSIADIGTNLSAAVLYAQNNYYYNRLYKRTINTVPIFALLSLQTSESVPVNPVQAKTYYVAIKNQHATKTATFYLNTSNH